ncbi:response regulator transcription factor [Streptomyces sp. OE57]|uniref:helix-turn-helix transcriptional regulator n=1 Tax=Streptomyces lacaronensis TaxID=3379885 RepID=UPI0039B72CEC
MREIVVSVHDGDPLSRAGLVGCLRSQRNLSVVEGTESAPQSQGADVAVTIIDQVDSHTATRLRRLVAEMHKRVVLVTNTLDEMQLRTVLESGVQAIVWRHQATAERLVRAVESAARHEGDLPSDLLTRLLTQMERIRRREESTSEEARRLSPRELSVLELVAKGLDTREIAAQLSYSERTVKGVLHGIMTRMYLKNRAHAVAFAIREGYI